MEALNLTFRLQDLYLVFFVYNCLSPMHLKYKNSKRTPAILKLDSIVTEMPKSAISKFEKKLAQGGSAVDGL